MLFSRKWSWRVQDSAMVGVTVHQPNSLEAVTNSTDKTTNKGLATILLLAMFILALDQNGTLGRSGSLITGKSTH